MFKVNKYYVFETMTGEHLIGLCVGVDGNSVTFDNAINVQYKIDSQTCYMSFTRPSILISSDAYCTYNLQHIAMYSEISDNVVDFYNKIKDYCVHVVDNQTFREIITYSKQIDKIIKDATTKRYISNNTIH